MLQFFGGCSEMIIPDNLRSGVSKACRYDPDLNASYQQLAEHYQVAVVPARPYKPKDKTKAEVGVQGGYWLVCAGTASSRWRS